MKLLAFVSFQVKVRSKTVCRQLGFYAPLSLKLDWKRAWFPVFLYRLQSMKVKLSATIEKHCGRSYTSYIGLLNETSLLAFKHCGEKRKHFSFFPWKFKLCSYLLWLFTGMHNNTALVAFKRDWEHGISQSVVISLISEGREMLQLNTGPFINHHVWLKAHPA